MKPGGQEGGEGAFFGGLVLLGLGIYLFFDSVHVATAPFGWMSGRLGGMGGGTTSMGLIFVPFFIGVAVLFFDATKRWAWWLSGLGLAIIAVEILSRIRFVLDMKTTHFLMLLIMIAAGAGLLARSYLVHSRRQDDQGKSDS